MASCTYCRAEVEPRSAAECPACATLLHAECAAELHACPTLGCPGRPPGLNPAAGPSRAPALKPGDAPPSSAPRLLILALVLIALTLAGWHALDGRSPLRRRASVDGQLLLVPLEGVDPSLVAAVADGITREYGLRVDLVPGPAPDAPALPRERSAPLDADALIAQGAAVVGDRARAAGVVGYLVVTHADISDAQSTFVFGLADRGRGVMSTARFTDGDPRAARRSVAQALSSTGLILGAPRCQSPACPRAYAGDVVAHDEKGDELCGACVEALRRR